MRELLGCATDDLESEFGVTPAYLWLRKGARGMSVHGSHDRIRNATWRKDPEPRDRFEVRDARFDRAERALEARQYAARLRICETGIAHHLKSERLYQLAIRTCRLAGWRGEGACLYERCRAGLSSELGLRPSRAIEDEHLMLPSSLAVPERMRFGA